MATNSIGAGKHNVGGSVNTAIRDALKGLATESGVGIGTYMTCLMIHAVEERLVFPNAREMKGRASNPVVPVPKTIAHGLRESAAQRILRKKRTAA